MTNLELKEGDTVCAATFKALIAEYGIASVHTDEIFIGSGNDELGQALLQGIGVTDVFTVTASEDSSLARLSLLTNPTQQSFFSVTLKGLSPQQVNEDLIFYTDIKSQSALVPCITHDRAFSHFTSDQIYQLKRAGFSDGEIESQLEEPQWSVELVDLYEGAWDWDNLSCSLFLPWSDDLFEKYADRFNWDHISTNVTLLWSAAFMDKYSHKLNWSLIPLNESIPWNGDLIARYFDKINWNALMRSSFMRSQPVMTQFYNHVSLTSDMSSYEYDSLIQMQAAQLEHAGLSDSFIEYNPKDKWSLEFFDEHADKWDWDNLSSAIFVPWSVKLLERYADKLSFIGLSSNPSLPWSPKISERLIAFLEHKPPPWKPELFDTFKGRWIFTAMSSNTSKELWSQKLINKHINKWDWEVLSENKSLPWTDAFLSQHQERWNWNAISLNQAIKWTEPMLDAHKDDLNWENLTTTNEANWTDELLDKYKDYIDWDKLAESYEFKRTFENIKRFEAHWCFLTLNERDNHYLRVRVTKVNNRDADIIQVLMVTKPTELEPQVTAGSFMTYAGYGDFENDDFDL